MFTRVTVAPAGQVDPEGHDLLECGPPKGAESLLAFELETVAKRPPCDLCGTEGVLLSGWLRRRPKLGDAQSAQDTAIYC